MIKVLVLGSDGYIGTALSAFLKRKDVDVTGVDIGWFGKAKDTLESDYKTLGRRYLSRFDTIVVLSAHSSVGMSKCSFPSVFKNNVRNHNSLLAKIEGLPKRIKVIYASSSSVYGDTFGEVVTETHNTAFYPHNNYDITKYMTDLSSPQYDVEYYGMRFGTVNGYSPVMRDDIMINAMVTAAKETGRIRLFSGGTLRPILGINDLCRALYKVIVCEKDNRGIYNLASFNSTSEKIADEVGKVMKVEVVKEEDEANASSYSFAISTEKFEKTFSFEFKEDFASIVKGIVDNYDTIHRTARKEPLEYEL